MITRPGTQDEATLREVRDYRLLDIRPTDVVLDLGGCIGAFGEVVTNASARVIAVEPEPDNARLYRMNVPTAEVLEMAVSYDLGFDQLWRGSTNSHALGKRRGRNSDLLVETTTLPYLLRTYEPDIVKCDIEGAEYLLDWSDLTGVREIALEFHFTPKRQWRQLAYTVRGIISRQGFVEIKSFKDTGKNWNCVVIWRRQSA